MSSRLPLTPGTDPIGEVHITVTEVSSLNPLNDDVLDKKKQITEPIMHEHDLKNHDLTTINWSVDPQNPINWSPIRKWTTVSLLVITNFIAATCTSAFEPALPAIMADFHSTNDSIASLTVSIYTIGYCLGPLVIAPISELYGHVTVLYPGYIGFMLALAVCGSSKSLPLFIVFRAIMGLAAITFVLMGPAIVADLIPREKRGFALSIMSAGPVVGPTIGPVIGGYIVENISWRWTFYSTLIAVSYFPTVHSQISNYTIVWYFIFLVFNHPQGNLWTSSPESKAKQRRERHTQKPQNHKSKNSPRYSKSSMDPSLQDAFPLPHSPIRRFLQRPQQRLRNDMFRDPRHRFPKQLLLYTRTERPRLLRPPIRIPLLPIHPRTIFRPLHAQTRSQTQRQKTRIPSPTHVHRCISPPHRILLVRMVP